MAFLNRGVFFMPIQPLFSYCPRCVVSPFITYFELVDITNG